MFNSVALYHNAVDVAEQFDSSFFVTLFIVLICYTGS